MTATDPIADMLTRIRNAYHALHKDVRMPFSRIKEAIAVILKAERYIDDFSSAESKLIVQLKYFHSKPLITGLQRISTPGRRVYVGTTDIPHVQNGLGISILSTSQGILEGDFARQINVGGELLCKIW
ncbi:30S ribosomal subunit protein S8 [Desulfovibrionales bacterium]